MKFHPIIPISWKWSDFLNHFLNHFFFFQVCGESYSAASDAWALGVCPGSQWNRKGTGRRWNCSNPCLRFWEASEGRLFSGSFFLEIDDRCRMGAQCRLNPWQKWVGPIGSRDDDPTTTTTTTTQFCKSSSYYFLNLVQYLLIQSRISSVVISDQFQVCTKWLPSGVPLRWKWRCSWVS